MGDTKSNSQRRPVIWSFKFGSVTLLGSLTAALICSYTPPAGQIAFLGTLVSILTGLFVSYLEQEERREQRRTEMVERLHVPLALAPDHELFDQYCAFAESLIELAQQTDPALRQYALLRLASLTEQVRSLASGKIVFSSTETWRTVYEQILQSADLKSYRSVAWVKSKDYWQDQPGKQTMKLNYALVGQGLDIRRIIIVRGELWPSENSLPVEPIGAWIEDQQRHGIHVSLVRESVLVNEADLLCDMGIYGNRATGVQEVDEQSRTVRFTLHFDQASISLANDRWQRLALYAKPVKDLRTMSGSRAKPTAFDVPRQKKAEEKKEKRA